LCAHHHKRLAHDRVYFPRHDRAARLRGGQSNFANAASRSAPEPANVVGDFEESHGDCFQMSARFDNCVLAALSFKMIFRLIKCDPGALLDMVQDFLGKIEMAIQTSADCGSAQCDLTQSFDSFLRTHL